LPGNESHWGSQNSLSPAERRPASERSETGTRASEVVRSIGQFRELRDVRPVQPESSGGPDVRSGALSRRRPCIPLSAADGNGDNGGTAFVEQACPGAVRSAKLEKLCGCSRGIAASSLQPARPATLRTSPGQRCSGLLHPPRAFSTVEVRFSGRFE